MSRRPSSSGARRTGAVQGGNRHQRLPPWARLTPPQERAKPQQQQDGDSDSDVDAAWEDAHLRTRAYHAAARRIEAAARRAFAWENDDDDEDEDEEDGGGSSSNFEDGDWAAAAGSSAKAVKRTTATASSTSVSTSSNKKARISNDDDSSKPQSKNDNREAEAQATIMVADEESSSATEEHSTKPPAQWQRQQEEDEFDAAAALFALPPPPLDRNGNSSNGNRTPHRAPSEETADRSNNNTDSDGSNLARLLLPVTVLDCPAFDGRDRAAWVGRAVRRAGPRACAVRLRVSGSHGNNGNDCKDELVRQCLRQEPGRDWHRSLSSPSSTRKKKRKKHRSNNQPTAHSHSHAHHHHRAPPELPSRTGILTAWAARTRAFDAIRVYCECDDGGAHNGQWTDLLQWCASRRACWGLPLEVVWMPPHAGFRQPVALPPAAPSAVGLRIRVVALPAPSAVLQRFQEELLKNDDDDDDCLGSLVFQQPQPQSVDAVRRVFCHQNRSAVHAVRQLQRGVAERLAAPGSFWTAAPLLLPRHARRMTALLLDAGWRRSVLGNSSNNNKNSSSSNKTALLEWLASLEVRRRLQATARRVQRILYDKYYGENNDNGSSSRIVVPYLLQRQDKFPIHDQTLTDDDRRILLEPVAAQIRNLSSATATTVFAQLELFPDDRAVHEPAVRRDLQHSLNQLVVLLDRCTTVVQVQRCLVEILQQQDSGNANNDCDENESGRLPQPRRDHVTALLEDLEHDENRNSDNLDNSKTTTVSDIHIPGLLYRIILDRAAIPESEWFRAFYHERQQQQQQQQQHDLGLPEAFRLFGCGVRHLQISGLIRPRRIAGKSETTYEKTALVWCGGD